MRRILILSLAGLVSLAGLAFLWLRPSRKFDWIDQQLEMFPHPQKAYDFQLVDQDGKPFRLDQLEGKVVLFTFGFTHCPNICPTTLADLAAAYRLLPKSAQEQTRVLFVSVDPERDSPKVLKEYVPFFDDHFIGLTGSAAQIKKTALEYGAIYEKQPAPKEGASSYTIQHSTYVYVIEPDGQWRGLYRRDQISDPERIAKDVREMLAADHG
ncbi:MAG: SCO family protein [Chthoniobacterales bacterium]